MTTIISGIIGCVIGSKVNLAKKRWEYIVQLAAVTVLSFMWFRLVSLALIIADAKELSVIEEEWFAIATMVLAVALPSAAVGFVMGGVFKYDMAHKEDLK